MSACPCQRLPAQAALFPRTPCPRASAPVSAQRAQWRSCSASLHMHRQGSGRRPTVLFPSCLAAARHARWLHCMEAERTHLSRPDTPAGCCRRCCGGCRSSCIPHCPTCCQGPSHPVYAHPCCCCCWWLPSGAAICVGEGARLGRHRKHRHAGRNVVLCPEGLPGRVAMCGCSASNGQRSPVPLRTGEEWRAGGWEAGWCCE